jgi:hypothetical protein
MEPELVMKARRSSFDVVAERFLRAGDAWRQGDVAAGRYELKELSRESPGAVAHGPADPVAA